MTEIWVGLIVFIVSLVIARSSKPTWYRAIATMIASLIGGVGVLALAVFVYLFFGSSSDCNSNVGGFYENNSALCYNREKVSTLTGKSNGKATPITKFVILDKDKALVYPEDMETQIIFTEDGELKVVTYEDYKFWERLHEEYEVPVTPNVDYKCRGSSSKRYFNVLTAPQKPNNDGAKAICYRGEDYTQTLAKQSGQKGLAGDGLRITSTWKVKDLEVMYVALYNDNTGKAAIERVFLNNAGKLAFSRGLIVKSRDIPDASPDASFALFGIDGSDVNFNMVYFNVNESTSTSIYRFKEIPGRIDLPVKISFFSGGSGLWVGDNGNISVGFSYIENPQDGRQWSEELIDKKGKKVCDLVSEDIAPTFLQQCKK
ncbi:hypothetical protein [Photorhabdus bodei]|uniref:hypothetical protein n=1 Tax=Photorhabdus bodei TaxID=2029681 RepID=UPI001E4AE278|nr:hypothetical protein [Photorhabdus bodei]MCC8466657.1 hypothetical protein [Photorhabdus bodei]